MTNMITWTNFAASTGAATTVWKYDGYRGFLTNKVYADAKGPSYDYTKAGRLKERKWARAVTTTYTNNAAGDLMAVIYSDGTRAVTNTYDRLGRLTTVQHGSDRTVTLAYNNASRLLSEAYSGGPLTGLTLTNGYDSLLRRTRVGVSGQSAAQNDYAYDGASRLLRVTNASDVAEYSYLANSKLFATVTFRRSGTTRMTTTRQYDFLNRLTEIKSAPTGTNSFYPLTYRYRYNQANQRTRVTHADGSFWFYDYDALGQVKSGKKYWSDGTPVAGQQFEYGYDDIGNRTQTKSGGDSQGQGLRTANYTANNLNQYTGRDVPGAADIIGIAHGLSTVTVGGVAAYRKGEYFQGLLSANNSAAAVYPSISTIATLSGTSQTNTGNLFLPKTPEGFSYDDDGNMTGDGRWIYSWDGENRLKSLESYSGAPTNSKRKLEFEYDHQGRRIQRIVSTHNGSSWVAQSTNRFVHDGWNLLAEFTVASGANSLTRVYVWGTDLSGSMQGAGGVGGLFMVRQVSGTSGTHFAAYDGNGNVTGLVNASNGNVSANYEYDPFGQTIRATGDMALLNPIRFSTKYTDGESGFLYYGYRYYDPNAGRWVNRDPIEELAFQRNLLKEGVTIGEANFFKNEDFLLYIFVGNNPSDNIDFLGLSCMRCGLSVDGALRLTHSDVISRFNKLSSWQRVKACAPIWLPAGNFHMAWDMTEMTWNWSRNMRCGRSATCDQTVTVGGKCFNAWDVNYMLYGWASQLCGMSLIAMRDRVIAWKALKADFDRLPGALAFSVRGWSGGLTPLPPEVPPIGYPSCVRCPRTYPKHLGSVWP
jgi:RHS repeat-associated protein